MRRGIMLLVSALILAVPAYADAISVSPLEVIGVTALDWLPWVLVIAVVVLTALVMRKKKK